MTQVVGPNILDALNETVELIEGAPVAYHSVTVQGTFVASIVLEGSADGVTWIGLKLTQASTAGTVASDVVTAPGVYSTTVPTPMARVRARVSAFTSGSAAVTVQGGS